MRLNKLLSSLIVIVVVFSYTVLGQEKPTVVDYSAIWNAAHRVLLGLDQATPAQGAQYVNAEATMNPLSPSNNLDIQVFNPCLFWQSENSIGVNFSNPNQLMVSTNGQIPLTPTVVQQAWAFSTDNGVTWPASLQSENIPAPIINCLGDPVAFFDRSSRAYYSTIGASGTSAAGMFFVSTTDFGATWSARSNADPNSSTGDDKQHAAADFSGTFPNNVYCAWTDFNVTGSPVIFNRSTDQGQTWLARQTIQIGSNRGQGVHIGIGPNGEVYLLWAHYTTGTAEVGVGMAKSTDGGATFSTPTIVFPINGIRISNGAISALNGTRASSFPYFDVDRSNGPRRGWIYAAIPELDVPTSGQADIYLHRSSTGGTTWDAPIKINGPDVQAGKWQFMASIAVDPMTGGITVSYYSMDSTGTNFMANRYAAYSADGGTTWDNWVISDMRALWGVQGTPNTNATYNGDYYETTAMGGRAWALWTDRRSGATGSFNKAYIERIEYADPIDPSPPSSVSAFSDYSTPTSMRLQWTRPTTLVNGNPITPFVMRIKRNGVQITERPQTDSTFTDTGLIDGTPYTYIFQTRLTGNDSLSFEVTTNWIAGGSRIPKGPTNLTVTGTQAAGYKIKWRNPSQQIDGTRLDDLAGLRLYRDGVLATTLVRTVADTGRVDSTLDNPAPGLHRYYVTVIDNEIPVNESAQSNSGDTPIELPVQEFFATPGAPNPILWRNVNAVVDTDAVGEPSVPYSLNFAGNTTGLGLDTLTSNAIDLSGRQGQSIKLGYWQQPQGGGDVPEAADSLITEALNDQGGWIALQKLPGAAVRPFQFVSFNMDSVSPGTGTFFFNGFKFRLRSKATTVTSTRQDDWFVDDVFFGVPTGTPVMAVAPQSIVDTVLVGKRDSTRYSFAVSNTNSFGTSLTYTVAESPAIPWLSVSPTGGSIPGGSSNTIRVIIDFTGIVQGNYTTSLIVTGNAPANTSDTVNVSFRVNNAPVIGTTPASFAFNLNQGDSVSSSLKIKNTGLGPLTYTTGINGGFAGDTATNIGSSQLNLTTTSLLLRGGVVGITRTIQLTEIKPYLTITNAVQLAFVVYENTVQTGTFTKIFERIATSGTGTQFYSSGPMSLTLQAGKFYAIGVAWSAGLNYFWSTNIPVPVATSFGSITGGLATTITSFPPPATVTQSALSSLYYTQIATANGKWLNITTNGSGTVNPGDSTLVGFKVTTAVVPAGTQNSAIVVNSNDPVTPTDTTNVALTVITSVTERGSEIPLTYELSQNYPNPFNPTTKIEFALPEESTIRLKVYNILGQEIATLANEQRPAGYFVAEWNATNNFGNKVSSGVYFYKMEATSVSSERSFSSLKKMLILK